MSGPTVSEFDHFVSFAIEGPDGKQVFVQYSRDQVWLDENGVWQVRASEKPFYVGRSAPAQAPQAKIGPAILSALAAAPTASFGGASHMNSGGAEPANVPAGGRTSTSANKQPVRPFAEGAHPEERPVELVDEAH